MNCPRCHHDHDLITRITGDQMLCSCGTWLLVTFRDRGVKLKPLGQGAPLFPAVDVAALLTRQRVRARLRGRRRRKV